MKLMQELMTQQVTEEDEVEASLTTPEIARFKRIWDVIERDLDHLENVMKEDSQFAKLVAKGNGDVKLFQSAIQSFKTLYDQLHDVQMSVGINQGDKW